MAALRYCLLLLAALALLPERSPAQEPGRRVALVIGNSAYEKVPTLANPVNDARLVANALRRAGFETVTVRTDLGVGAFRRAIASFATEADGADAALIYYAGHGIEANRRNWLIPTDAALTSSTELAKQAINANLLVAALAKARIRVLVLDACRDNPFGKAWPAGVSAVSRGLGSIDVDDVLVIFAAAPGQTAADGDDANSPFATALADHLPEPGLAVQLLGGVVRDAVMAATGEAQRPFISASITGQPYYFATPRRTRSLAVTAGEERWTARQPSLSMQEVSVARSVDGELYRYRVDGIYPAQRPSGAATSAATRARVRWFDVADPPAAQRTSVIDGSWAPGAPFTLRFAIPRAWLDAAQRPVVRFCMVDAAGCVPGPDVAQPPG